MRSSPPPARLLLNVREAAESLGISQRTLWSLTQPRGPIPSVRIGARVLYSLTALQVWIASQAGVSGDAVHENH